MVCISSLVFCWQIQRHTAASYSYPVASSSSSFFSPVIDPPTTFNREKLALDRCSTKTTPRVGKKTWRKRRKAKTKEVYETKRKKKRFNNTKKLTVKKSDKLLGSQGDCPISHWLSIVRRSWVWDLQDTILLTLLLIWDASEKLLFSHKNLICVL